MLMYFDVENLFFNTNDFEIEKQIGEGTYTTAHLAKRISDNQSFVIKIYKSNTNKVDEQKQFLRGIISQTRINHPSICPIQGINFHSFNDPTLLQPLILLEYFPHGSLGTMLDKERIFMSDPNFNWTKKYITLLGICHAMKSLHLSGVIHRDLKPDNVLIDNNFHPKISGFTLARPFKHPLTAHDEFEMELVGTPLYLAPELLKDDIMTYSVAVDVYSFAILAYEVVTGRRPFQDGDRNLTFFRLAQSVLSGERPLFSDDVTVKMKELIEKCWNEDADMRPSFEELFEMLASDPKSYCQYDIDEVEIHNFIDMLNESR